ncbi:leucine-rich repeat protein 1-like [Microplitis mediator]|uniref:leucine-rich repeat protein 1-like n=1 Tax=Microplitis mediator TaxID=375433 RepID=UPI002552C581|nr:leucine-rich repeat protein 1-like [Microplitis mediator]
MKLVCNVEVNHRGLLAGSNVAGKKSQSCLSIGKQNKNDELFIFLQSKPRNGNQMINKYKIDGNIETVFTKFINDGKSTIRIKEPPVDLNIKSNDSLQLKSFLKALHLGFNKQLNNDTVIKLKDLQSKTNSFSTSTVKKKVFVKSKAEYPVLEGFPRTTEELHVIGLGRKSFDRQILRLQSLRVLDLSNNAITSIPKELGNVFAHLTELNLASNLLGEVAGVQNTYHSIKNKWLWLNGSSITTSLRLLDLSDNTLKYLPKQVGKLKGLVTLKVSHNQLESLPAGIGVLPGLKYLDLSVNNLKSLPGSFRNLRLDSLNVSKSFASIPLAESAGDSCFIMSLKELSARAVVNNCIYYDASIVPATLVDYMDDANFCMCGSSCFDEIILKSTSKDLRFIASSIISDAQSTNHAVFNCTFCSSRCVNNFKKRGL